ncbi:MAG: hypothetical protein Q8R82_14245 [Hyphomonadaceae bacterium]|nr:hypothetical protein [Hyphomonadaceae bacterium]
MNRLELKALADQTNQPKIDQYLREYPIETLKTEIKTKASEGYYGYEFELPFRTHQSVADYLVKEFKKLGFDTSYRITSEDIILNFHVKIEWN